MNALTRWLRAVQAGIGRRAAWAALAALVAGIAAFATGAHGAGAPRTYGALIASWLFFAGAAAGALAFRAFFRIVDASWARQLRALSAAASGFGVVAMVVLVVIVAGIGGWAPWLGHPGETSLWLGVPRFTMREIILGFVIFGFGYLQLRPQPGREDGPTPAMAVTYLLLYAVVLSMWAFDFVLAPDPTFSSTVIGPYLFTCAFITGTAMVTLLALARGELDERERGDAAALVVALAIFWAYLFWSQFLTVWYGNLPDEIGFFVRRDQGGWGVVTLAVVAGVFAVPFLTLLHPRARRSTRVLSGLLVVQLVGLWLDCHLLVVPSLSPVGAGVLNVRDVLIALGLLGAFALSSAPALEPVKAQEG